MRLRYTIFFSDDTNEIQTIVEKTVLLYSASQTFVIRYTDAKGLGIFETLYHLQGPTPRPVSTQYIEIHYFKSTICISECEFHIYWTS